MNSASREVVWSKVMGNADISPFSLTSVELRQAVDDYDNYMDVVEAQLTGRMSIDLQSKLSEKQKRALIKEIMTERMNG